MRVVPGPVGASGGFRVPGSGFRAPGLVLFAVAIIVERRIVQPRLPEPVIVEVLR